MDKNLINSLFRNKINEAKSFVGLRKTALSNARRDYELAKRALDSMEESLGSAEAELGYLEKQRKESIGYFTKEGQT